LIGKIGSHTRATKKKEEPNKNIMMIYDRPLSAKVTDKKGGKVAAQNPINDKLGGYDMLANAMAKKRYPSSNGREEAYKWK